MCPCAFSFVLMLCTPCRESRITAALEDPNALWKKQRGSDGSARAPLREERKKDMEAECRAAAAREMREKRAQQGNSPYSKNNGSPHSSAFQSPSSASSTPGIDSAKKAKQKEDRNMKLMQEARADVAKTNASPDKASAKARRSDNTSVNESTGSASSSPAFAKKSESREPSARPGKGTDTAKAPLSSPGDNPQPKKN